jgi:5-formyltetrahydrofolate cyclo-ligase
MADAKSAQRRELTRKLKALTPIERSVFSARALTRLLATPFYAKAATVAAYASFGAEFPTAELLATVIKNGKWLGLPRIDPTASSMTFHAVTNFQQDLESNPLGFFEPRSNLPVIDVAQIDLVLVPGVGFDERGNRLGRGAGYYDRFLARPEIRAYTCALAFECQIANAIITAAYDHPVDCIVTEDRTIQVQAYP